MWFIRPLIPVALFYFGWWGLILLVMGDYTALYQILLTNIALAGNLALLPNFTRDFKNEILWWFCGATTGFLLDSMLFFAGVFTLKQEPAMMAPLWIGLLWLLFSASFAAMENLRRSKAVLILSGAIGGPLAYWIGQPLGLIQYSEPKLKFVLIHAAIWAVLFPALFLVRDRILKLKL